MASSQGRGIYLVTHPNQLEIDGKAVLSKYVADPLLMPQLSVWTDVRSLKHFAFRSDHVSYYKRRREWFEDIEPPFSVLWWRQASLTRGLEPSLAEAFDRLRHLKANGPSEFAFTIKTAAAFPKPEGACPPLPSYDAVAAEAGRSQAM